MSKKKAKKEPVQREAEKAPKKEKAETVAHENYPAHVEPMPAEPVAAKVDTLSDTLADTPPESPPKPSITYEVMESGGTDDQFEYVRVNVTVNPPFNGFSEAIITVPCPIHNSKGLGKTDREALIKEKALWKVTNQIGPGASQFTAEDVKPAEKA